jgi:plastocyanin
MATNIARWGSVSGLISASVVLLAGCTGSASNAASSESASAPSPAKPASCDPAQMVNVINDRYDQASVNLDAGNTLLVTNTTNDTFTLVTKPDDGLRYMVLDPQEMEHVPFTQPGTYVLSSKEHPATALTVHVSPTRRYTCGEQPVAEIHFGAHHAFAPESVTVNKGESIQIDNDTTQNLTVDSSPDLGVGMGHQIYHPGEHQTLLFNDGGPYTFRVEQLPGPTLHVNVANTAAK